MDSKEHDLYTGPYFNLFQYEGEGRANKENVLVKQYGVSLTDRVVSQNYCRATLENGNKSPTKALVDSYLMVDGLPMDKSPLYKAPLLTTDVFVNRDTRLSDDVLKKGIPIFLQILCLTCLRLFCKNRFYLPEILEYCGLEQPSLLHRSKFDSLCGSVIDLCRIKI